MIINHEIKVYFDASSSKSDLYLYATDGCDGDAEELTFKRIFKDSLKLGFDEYSLEEKAEYLQSIKKKTEKFLLWLETETEKLLKGEN